MADAPAMQRAARCRRADQLGQVGSRRRAGCAQLPRRQGGAARGPAHPQRATCSPCRSRWAAPTVPATRSGPAAAASSGRTCSTRAPGTATAPRPSPADCTTPTTPRRSSCRLDAVRRARPRLVRRQALERLRRARHHRRDGPGLGAADRGEGRGRAGCADRHGAAPRQGLPGQGRDLRPHRPRGGSRRAEREHRAARCAAACAPAG